MLCYAALCCAAQGWVRSIGISNMGVPEMTQLAATAKVTPAVNQIELHPWLQNKHVTDYCKEHNIVLEVSTSWAHARRLVSNLPISS